MKKKTFDCVEMKHRIQEQHLKLFEGKSDVEQREMVRAAIAGDPRLARFWKAAKRAVRASSP
ncbi:MAG: hypothetical protein HY719_11970 [Planctomycetes bacterium]|nr:hypothetical protein [Planctomycetota bacterium]